MHAAAAQALDKGRLDEAYRLLQSRLAENPHDPPALRLLAGVASASGRPDQAEHMLRHALALAPGDEAARYDLAGALAELGRAEEGLAEIERLLAVHPEERLLLGRKAALLTGLGRVDAAIPIREALLARHADDPDDWLALGHDLRAIGRGEDAAAAYRRSAGLAPDAGAAWWSLANLKTAQFVDDDLDRMEASLGGAAAPGRVFIHFALGRALQDRGAWARSFDQYSAGNRLRRAEFEYRPEEVSGFVDRCIQLFDGPFVAKREDWGRAGEAPVFIVGMPRSGSTLVEQILAGHSAVEGAGELPILPMIAAGLGAAPLGLPQCHYPDALAALDGARAEALGADYLARSRPFRRSGRPIFTDKLPTNWAHAALALTILPGARIIDVRRDPLDCCWSNYTQLYAHEQRFAYDLAELGAYYRDQARLMDHLAATLPSRVYRLRYARLVEDAEGEIRRLLDFLGLSFQPACLRPHETRRAVRTPSAQQVRRPINRDGITKWRPYEPHLGPLKQALRIA